MVVSTIFCIASSIYEIMLTNIGGIRVSHMDPLSICVRYYLMYRASSRHFSACTIELSCSQDHDGEGNQEMEDGSVR